MDIRLLTSPADLAVYDQWVKTHPQGNLWQSLEWRQYQQALGREVHIYAASEGSELIATALVVVDRTSFGLCTWDIPRGPLFGNESGEMPLEALRPSGPNGRNENLLKKIMADAKKDKCLQLTYSPAIPFPGHMRGSRESDRHEQPEATRILDLTTGDDALLAQMHPKGRYNIKVAEKNGVTVEQSTDVKAYGALAEKTAARDGFRAPVEQYKTFLAELPGSFLLLAFEAATGDQQTANGDAESRKPIAGLLGVTWPPSDKSTGGENNTGIYYYGASDYEHRALMAPYLLQWQAMHLCMNEGCTRYDLLGVAPPNSDDDHPWRGISSFKEKFGGELIVYPPEEKIVIKRLANTGLKMKRRIFG